ncbi:hypothetical protein Dimus_016777 [Dionaea muscipula]
MGRISRELRETFDREVEQQEETTPRRSRHRTDSSHHDQRNRQGERIKTSFGKKKISLDKERSRTHREEKEKKFREPRESQSLGSLEKEKGNEETYGERERGGAWG